VFGTSFAKNELFRRKRVNLVEFMLLSHPQSPFHTAIEQQMKRISRKRLVQLFFAKKLLKRK
jgi:hypothetical protein